MAERRMFAKTIIDSDAFLDMPLSAQALYFHLSMRADDDGFINNPKNIQRMIGCRDDDMKTLFTKKFVIPFGSGICVIKHWKIHNYIQSDRYHETKYKEEKSMLLLDENKAYRLPDSAEYPKCIQPVSNMDTQVRLELGKVSIGKDNRERGEESPQRSTKFTPPSVEEISSYCQERHNGIDPNKFYDFYASKGWMVGKNKMRDWKACVRTWEQRDKAEHAQPERKTSYDISEYENSEVFSNFENFER